MKRAGLYCLAVLVMLSCVLAFASAVAEAPVITLQPQSPTYTKYDVAIYTVKAEGTNLSATWYMQWLDKTYTISDTGGAMQDWEPFAGESYGARQLDVNTFSFTFEGIEEDLDGAYIWCVIEDGHYDVTSQKVRVSVKEFGAPPMILDIPAQLTVAQGEQTQIRCVAQAPGEMQLSFLWYETDTGNLEDIRAVNRGEETSDFLICDTSVAGTRNYICKVETSEGGIAYSSYVPVTVTEKAAPPETTAQTQPVPQETQETTEKPAEQTVAPTQPAETTQPTQPQEAADGMQQTKSGLPWWVILLIGLTAAGAGFGVAVLLVKKKV